MLTSREYRAVRELQQELEIRDYEKIYIHTYDFFGTDFIIAMVADSVETENPEMIIDCSISYLERYGVAHTVSVFERMYCLL